MKPSMKEVEDHKRYGKYFFIDNYPFNKLRTDVNIIELDEKER